jgi:hypothetical protein
METATRRPLAKGGCLEHDRLADFSGPEFYRTVIRRKNFA